MNRLFGDFFRDFWPGFLALDQNGDGTDGRDGRTGGRTGRTDERTDGTDGRNTVLQFYWDGEIQYYSTTYYLLFIFQKIRKSILDTTLKL